MRILAIDASSVPCSVAVSDAEGRVAYLQGDAAPHAVERLVPRMMACFREAGLAPSEVSIVAVNLGPGGFTGTRAGVAVARAFCAATGRPALGLTALAIAAEKMLAAGRSPPICVLRDAQRGEVLAQRFDADGSAIDEPHLLARPRAGAPLDGDWRTLVRLGEIDEAFSTVEQVERLSAMDLVRAARRRLRQGIAPVPGTSLHPYYLRPPDAAIGAGSALVRPG